MREWYGRKNDDGSIHSLGNGRMCCYEQGPDVIQLFGPPYSSPSLFKIIFSNDNYKVESEREAGTAVWRHTVVKDKERVGEMTDFVSSEIECFARRISCEEAIAMSFETVDSVVITENSKLYEDKGFSKSYLLYSPAGGFIYNDYPFPKKIYYQILATGDMKVEIVKNGKIEMKATRGVSEIYIVGGKNFEECRTNAKKVVEQGFDKLLSNAISSWKAFSSQRYDFDERIKKDFPLRNELIDAVDSVSCLIKAQQAEEGGVLAGYNYHLGYVRDQYGVSRCLLELGYKDEARKILDFYWSTWKKFGKIHNAQCMGVPGLFHVHENDEVEITGYLIIQAYNYLESSGDEVFLNEIFPMLEWAFEAQKRHIVNGMLPFNGDETYIAGGVLPRNTMNDGSAEATLLFITGGEKLVKWAEEKELWDKKKVELNRITIGEVKKEYRKNFIINGKLATNNPKRKEGIELPVFRHGVCEGCLESKKEIKPYFFGWTEKSKHDRYLCPECIIKNNLPKAEDRTYFLRSVILMPLYIGSDMFTLDEISEMVEEIILDYKKTGRLPSRPDGNITVGYDYGLFLYTLNKLNHPLAEEIYRKMISVIDQTGAWVEYYEDGKAFNTRCRPWESGINLEVAIQYAMKW